MSAAFDSPLLKHAASIAPVTIPTGIITVSDRASAGEYKDESGPALESAVKKLGWPVLALAVVPDDLTAIQNAVRSLVAQGCHLVLTTGGTGITSRDVTPEALKAIMRVELPGFGEVMRARSMELTPNAILSRCLAVAVEGALVIALPGKPAGAVDCLGFVTAAIPHAVKLVRREPTSC